MNALVKRFKLNGEVIAPPSKSVAHRLLIASCLSKNECKITNISYNQDVLATIDSLNALGANITKYDDYVIVEPSNFLKDVQDELKVRESGSTLRFTLPICLLTNKDIKLFGSERLLSRPMDVYESLCKEEGFEYFNNGEYIKVKGNIKPGNYKIRGDISSQFISGLLFALSYLNEKSQIEIIEPFESKSYVDLTIDALNTFGFNVHMDKNTIYIDKSTLKTIKEIEVEADESNASFLDSFNYLGSNVAVLGKNNKTKQGDKIYKDYFDKLKEGFATLDIADCPDLGPILIALGSLLNGVHLINTRRLKAKECDRGQAMHDELTKLGASIELKENEIIVHKKELRSTDEILDSHNDHRIVMSLVVVLSTIGGTIKGIEAVNKSFPDFFDKLKSINAEVSIYDD